MASWFTVSTRKDFNIRLWTKAVETRGIQYEPTTKTARRGRPAEEGEPPGKNDDMKNCHLLWVQLWWDYEEQLAAAKGRPPNYTLIHEPLAADSSEEEQANGAKLLAFYRWLLSWPLLGINTQVEKCSVGFFGHLLAAQFADCPKRLQEYKMFSPQEKDDLQAVAKRIATKVNERTKSRDPFNETIGAALTTRDMVKYYNCNVAT